MCPAIEVVVGGYMVDVQGTYLALAKIGSFRGSRGEMGKANWCLCLYNHSRSRFCRSHQITKSDQVNNQNS